MSKIPTISKMAAALVAQAARRFARRVGIRRPRDLDAALFDPPDSALCLRAAEVAREASSEVLFHHCMRTWAFGVAVGAQLERSVDRELLFAAAAMHDLGLTSAYAGPEWFEERGASAARTICAEVGLAVDKTEVIAEAIAIHDQLAAGSREPEIALVHFGAGLDVIGFHAEDVSRATTDAIVSRWPRLAMKADVGELLAREAERNPDSPVGLQFRLGFARRIRNAPFAS